MKSLMLLGFNAPFSINCFTRPGVPTAIWHDLHFARSASTGSPPMNT